MAKGDITNYADALATASGINIQPSAGVKQQIIAIRTTEANADNSTAASNDIIALLYDGTTRGYMGYGDAINTLTKGVIITNDNYLRLYNKSGTDIKYYNVILMEV